MEELEGLYAVVCSNEIANLHWSNSAKSKGCRVNPSQIKLKLNRSPGSHHRVRRLLTKMGGSKISYQSGYTAQRSIPLWLRYSA